MEVRVGRSECEAGAELLDGVVKIGLLEERGAVVLAEGGQVGAQGEGFGVERERAFGAASLDAGEGVVGEGGAGVEASCEGGLEDGNGGGGVSAGPEGEGERVEGLGRSLQ
jgi:hypothetical protein